MRTDSKKLLPAPNTPGNQSVVKSVGVVSWESSARKQMKADARKLLPAPNTL